MREKRKGRGKERREWEGGGEWRRGKGKDTRMRGIRMRKREWVRLKTGDWVRVSGKGKGRLRQTDRKQI